MMKSFPLILICLPFASAAQVVQTTTTENFYNKNGQQEKTIITVTTLPAQVPLKGVTFGIGMGWNHLFRTPKEFFLTTDTSHRLQVQHLSKSAVVLSSLISIKLGKVDADGNSNQLLARGKAKPANWNDRFAVNVSLNLAEFSSDGVAFNTSIDGGIGLGYFINTFTQVGVFYEMIRIRQMRDYFVDNFSDQAIPNGSAVYNALDKTDDNLFYSKYYSGVSFKVIFSLGNK